MNIDDLIYIDDLPSLDLHSIDSQTAKIYINDFIKDNIVMKNEFFVIIHGNGKGILRKATNEILKKNKYVVEYKLAFNNIGCTIVKIDYKKKC